MKHRIIAINLPQFHPFPENDKWWGKGFTEWTNVTKARPRFKGHYQPHLPADTGIYDMRLPETRQMQADMAREYGISGFCYYHYWFNGKQLMERPVNDMLKSGEPDFPFMLCWANENWTRNWDGLSQNILIKQDYSEGDDMNHIRYLCENVFPDKRYIRIDGKPVFGIYRIELFPDFKQTVEIWRKIAKEEYGMGLYLISAESLPSPKGKEALLFGLDATFEFQPLTGGWHLRKMYRYAILRRVCNRLPLLRKWPFLRNRIDNQPSLTNYEELVEKQKEKSWTNSRVYPCVSPSWDNSPRRENKSFFMLTGSTPALFGEWLRDVLTRFTPFSEEENLVFINAWNEWAEGNHMEPDQKWGTAYLEEVRKAVAEIEERKLANSLDCSG